MADVSKINGYDVKDTVARELLSRGIEVAKCLSDADELKGILKYNVTESAVNFYDDTDYVEFIPGKIIAVYFSNTNTATNPQFGLYYNYEDDPGVYIFNLSVDGSFYSGSDPIYWGTADHFVFYACSGTGSYLTWLGTSNAYSILQSNISDLWTAVNGKVPTTRTVNGLALSANITTRLVFTSGFSVTWTASTPHATDTNSKYPNRGAIALSGVTAAMYPTVTFGVAHAITGNYSPICECYAGGVYIWSKNTTTPTIESIVCQK